MLEATSDRKSKEHIQMEQKKLEFVNFLKDCFHEADADGSGTLDRLEFTELVENDDVHLMMAHKNK